MKDFEKFTLLDETPTHISDDTVIPSYTNYVHVCETESCQSCGLGSCSCGRQQTYSYPDTNTTTTYEHCPWCGRVMKEITIKTTSTEWTNNE